MCVQLADAKGGVVGFFPVCVLFQWVHALTSYFVHLHCLIPLTVLLIGAILMGGPALKRVSCCSSNLVSDRWGT